MLTLGETCSGFCFWTHESLLLSKPCHSLGRILPIETLVKGPHNKSAAGLLLSLWRRAGQRQNRSRKKQRVEEVIESLDLDGRARVQQRRDQDWTVDHDNQQ